MDIWIIVMLVLIVVQIVGFYLIFEGKPSKSRPRGGAYDSSRASWTSSAMQDAMDQGE